MTQIVTQRDLQDQVLNPAILQVRQLRFREVTNRA